VRTHPVPMTARFRELLVLTYAFPAPILQPLIPAALALDGYDGQGFVVIALVDMARSRSSRLPAAAAMPQLAAAFQLHDLTYAWAAGTLEPLVAPKRTGTPT
jgi:uncharacterized protein YqjF (DUF2071 family)